MSTSPMLEASWTLGGTSPERPAEWEEVDRCQLCGRSGPYQVVISSQEMFHRWKRGSQVKPWALVECACGLRFVSPRWTATYNQWTLAHPNGVPWSETLYRYGSFVPVPDPKAQINTLMSYHQGVYRGVRPLLRAARPAVIDVGSNVGWALKSFSLLDIDLSRSLAVDLEPNAIVIARDKLGLPAIESTVSALPTDRSLGPFDLIHCNDFIEHTLTPADDLRVMRRLVPRGAVLWLKTFVEDLDEPAGRTMLGPYSHFYHFTIHALRQVLEKTGWYPIRWWSTAGVQFVFVCVAL